MNLLSPSTVNESPIVPAIYKTALILTFAEISAQGGKDAPSL